jgi:hypothetical protein
MGQSLIGANSEKITASPGWSVNPTAFDVCAGMTAHHPAKNRYATPTKAKKMRAM